MFHRPRFKPHFRVAILEGEGIVLLSERNEAVLRGRLFQLLAPWLDGQLSADEIVAQLRGRASAAELYYALGQLERRGYLAENDDTFGDDEAALWSIQDVEPRTAAQRLKDATVSLSAVGSVSVESLRNLLQQLHVHVVDQGQFEIVLTDDYLRGCLQVRNQDALRTGRPWLLLKPLGVQIWLGPLFRPGQTGCWECLAQRLRIHRGLEGYVRKRSGGMEPAPSSRSHTPATLQIALGMAANAIAAWIARGESSQLEGNVLTLDVTTWATQFHTLVRRPQCPACGPPVELPRSVRAPVPQSPSTGQPLGDRDRQVRLEDTLERYRHHVSPITGAVSMLQRIGSPVDPVRHVYLAGPAVCGPQESLDDWQHDWFCRCSGKGASDLQARVSGLCEALERYSGSFQGDEPRRTARLRDLGDLAIHPNACMQFSTNQLRQRDAWNSRQSVFNWVPLPFDPEAEIEWSPIWSLTRRSVRYLPTALCYFGYPQAAEQAFQVSCSNGCAAGNTPEEAILHGFLELVERDGVALWWYNRVQRPAVALDAFDEPYLRQMRVFLEELQRDLWVLDLTTDLGIPVFAALSRQLDRLPERILLGFGAHLNPRIALLRAVTEINQMIGWVLGGEDREKPPETIWDRDIATWLETATLLNQPYLAPAPALSPRQAADFPCLETADLRNDLLACQGLLERFGLELLVLDQTRPDVGLPVFKVIVPGLRHYWARFGPGRLYEVPVRLGWLPRPTNEEDLNPIPMFL